jgi:nicotinamidase/pyrazinamidase
VPKEAEGVSTMKKIIFRTLGVLVLVVVFLFVYLVVFEKRQSVISDGAPIEKYGEQRSALMVIDIQESTTGTVTQNENLAKGSDSLIRTINAVIDRAARDSMPVIYVRSEITDPVINLINNSMEKGSVGAALDRRLKVVSNFDIPKDKEDAFCNPALDRLLTGNQINRLYVTGLDVAYCVNSTIIAAQNRGYEIFVIGDAVTSDTEELRDQMFKEFTERKVKFVRSDEFISRKDRF